MRALVVLCCITAVVGISSGNTSHCDPFSSLLGCTQWGMKDDGTFTNTLIVNRLNCTMTVPPARIMPWVAAPVRVDFFSVRSGNSNNPASDVAFYHPGEYMNIYVRALSYKVRYRGLLLFATDSNGVVVGKFEFAPESEAVPFWTPTYWQSVCATQGKGNAVLHKNADEKPYTMVFRWKAPAVGTGLVTFKALFKNGPANNGYFYWPNGARGDLKLSERNTAVDGAVPPLIWFKASTNAQTCAQVCAAAGRSGVDTTLMASTVVGGEGFSIGQPTAVDAYARSVVCRQPHVSSCASDTPAVDGNNFCTFTSASCPSWRSTATDNSRLRYCACTTGATAPPNCTAEAPWPATVNGGTARLTCPVGQTGNWSRQCGTDGAWGVVVNTCVYPPNCTDGIQNQGEFAIDCGGTSPCPACLNCPAINCGAHGKCIEGNPATCQCNESYTGDRCQTAPVNPCANWTCSPVTEVPPRGTCSVVQPGNTPFCACTVPFSGAHCEILPAATCSDGIMNQGELGIDCGGPCPRPCDTFFWEVGTWSDCSKTCGGGIRTRGQACKNSTGQVQPNTACAAIHPPITQESCSPDPCPVYSWVAGPWQNCSTTCGTGTQVRNVDCWSTIGPSIVTQPGLCPDSLKPATSQNCNTALCTAPRWVSEPWSDCDRSCGGGMQTRVSRCKNPSNTEVDASMCTQTMPPGTQACNIFACVAYSWYMCPAWGPCTATCNGGDGMLGQQYRDLYCVDDTDSIADYSLCDATKKPGNVLTVCNTQKCSSYNWMANGDWSACNGTYRTRGFHCHAANGGLALNSDCENAGIPLPRADIPCTPGQIVCPPLILNNPVVGAAPRPLPGLAMLVALLSTLFFSPRLGSFSVVAVLLFAFVGQTEAHNWLHTPGRASFQASTIAPCQGRKTSDLHAQVGPNQRFVIKFATGHERDSYFVTVRGEDADWLGNDNFETMVDDYLSKAPAEDHLSIYKRRYHGYPTPRGNQASYDSTTDPIGAQFTGIVPTTAPNYPNNTRSPNAGMYNYKDSVLSPDRRASYTSGLYPWIIEAYRVPHLMHLPDDFDAFFWTIPSGNPAGHYIVHWRWSGYYDCVDVDLRTANTQYPDGLVNKSAHIWSRVDHCQYEQPLNIMSQCMEVFNDVTPCIRAVPQGDWNINNRYGLNVVPFRNPASVNPNFLGEIAIPWRRGECSSSWNRFTGVVSESPLNWATWDAKTTVQTGVVCNDWEDARDGWDLKRAVAYCVGLGPTKCGAFSWNKGTTGTDVHTGTWSWRFCGAKTTTADTNWNTYTAKTLSTVTYNTAAAVTTVNFYPNTHVSPTPVPGQLNDGGAPYGAKTGGTFGWNCNSSVTCEWCCTYDCGTFSGCCANNIDYTMEISVSDDCPQQRGLHKFFDVAVANGVYEVQTRHYYDGSDVDISGCSVEGARISPSNNFATPAGVQITWKVEVTDGKLTLNGDAGRNTFCGPINWMKYKQIAAPGTWNEVWMPPATANPTWEQDNLVPVPVGLVTIENFDLYRDDSFICSSWWLFKGSYCYDHQPMNFFTNAASEGAIVGVSNSSCLGGSCPGASFTCGTINLPHPWETRQYVDCNGKIGRYVWVRMPGSARYLTISIEAFRYMPDVPVDQNPLVCYGVEARPSTATDPEFIISLDPEDPIFYSTCYVREPNVIFLDAAAAPDPARWRFAGRCIDCESFKVNQALAKPTTIPKMWEIEDGKCIDCDKENQPLTPASPAWVHTMMMPCDDPADPDNGATSAKRGLPACTGLDSCQKQLWAKGRTDDEPTWGSAALSKEECMALGARDPDCTQAVTYINGGSWTVCKCQRSHACCGRCTSMVWQSNPSPDETVATQTYEFGANVDVAPDAFCARGLKSTDGSLCCPAHCKNAAGTSVCGADPYKTDGTSCRSAAGGGQCCKGAAMMFVNFCNATGAPCRLK